jgi:hypothetical protein
MKLIFHLSGKAKNDVKEIQISTTNYDVLVPCGRTLLRTMKSESTYRRTI